MAGAIAEDHPGKAEATVDAGTEAKVEEVGKVGTKTQTMANKGVSEDQPQVEWEADPDTKEES
jgi:hypothetical protein